MKDIIPENLIQCTFDFDAVPQKRCLICEEWYSATPEFFPRGKTRRDGLYPYCKECTNARNRTRYERKTPLPEVLPEGFKRCTQCKEVKPETEEHFFFQLSAKRFRSKCKVCNTASSKAYRLVHPEEQKARSHQYYLRNIETIREKSHQHYLDNIEYYRQRNQRYTKSGAYKIYRKMHPEVARASNRRRRARKRASGSFTTKQIQDQCKRQKGKCYYCKKGSAAQLVEAQWRERDQLRPNQLKLSLIERSEE